MMQRFFFCLLFSFSFCCFAFAQTKVEKKYYPSGEIECETPYENGMKEGVEKWYYPNGILQQDARYRHGKKDGLSRLYDKDGNLIYEIVFQNGEFVNKRELK
jgi:antitoxin component YwqK of YwqJK toxin-antitoxin module